jgi:putative Holliday junction resolvase
VRVVALDYGAARTGVAVSDPTGTIATPLGVVERAATPAGLTQIQTLVLEHGADLVVVGLPLTLRGERGAQAQEATEFVRRLAELLDVPVDTYDERFTTTLATRAPGSSPEDARAAAHLLDGYLAWKSTQES